jgi:hypothetical protein
MKIDHLVINVNEKYQSNENTIKEIREKGLPYEPKWGKGTKGFKASNLWIGNEYFEMIRLLKKDGGGWKPEWINQYNNGHRGLICLMIDVENLDAEYQRIINKSIHITEPEYLKFKWFFNLFTRTMPWRNSYVDFFQGVPMQIGFQQMKNKKALEFMHQYMIPNSKDNGVDGINKVVINGDFTKEDFNLVQRLFEVSKAEDNEIIIDFPNSQKLVFKKSKAFSAEVYAYGNNESLCGNKIEIENVQVIL